MTGDATAQACEVCLSSKSALKEVGGELHRAAFAHYSPPEDGWRTSYQNDLLFRCPKCGTAWLLQYWEIETPDTEFEEWGIRNSEWTRLTAEDVTEINSALASGTLLPQVRFRASP
jgi:hypothetical protein